MSATPRLRSGAFPQTPVARPRGRGAPPTPSPSRSPSPNRRRAPRASNLPLAPQENAAAATGSRPLIPLTVLDAPTQRFYAFAVYAALLAWRFYDWVQLVESDNAESFWLLMKWMTLDGVFLFCLPELRIPWLELAQPVVVALFFLHAIFDYMLMFNVPLPWTSWLLAVVKIFYDKELSTSEHYVKTSNILHNASLIRGRQVINILPEGSAVLNPDAVPFCLGGDAKSAAVPLHFNATVPVEVELIRRDLNTGEEESVMFSRGQLREVQRLSKRQSADAALAAVQYDFPVKKTGAYRLGRVLDEYKLEVQRKGPYTYIVPCPSARVVAPASPNRCLGDLSDLSLRVEGTPPLTIRYSRTTNGKDHSFHMQSLQPEGFSSPLFSSRSTTVAVLDGEDVSWARSQPVTVELNELMHVGGEWQYSIDEVQDAFGNVAHYLSPADDPDVRPTPKHLVQRFSVKERPKLRLQGCDSRNPLKVAKNKATNLPVTLDAGGRAPDEPYTITWQFSPVDTLTKNGEHGEAVKTDSFRARHVNDKPVVSAPGLYTLKSVSSATCEGEVQEPSSCLLLNPLEPTLSLRSEEIPDTCVGNSIGLRVDLDLIGTPPFVVRYDVVTNGEVRHERVKVPGMRYQMELVPRVAGHHKYIFNAVDDAVYKAQQLSGADMVLEQSVKPAARAMFSHTTKRISACLEEQVGVDVALFGEPPFTVEYELVHEGKRKAYKQSDIESTMYRVETPVLYQGGEYALALTSIQDKTGCRNFVQDEVKISVTRQQPRAAFGQIDNKRRAMVVEDAKVRLPLRLTGEGPWKLSYRMVEGGGSATVKTLRSDNDFLDVTMRGTYEIVDVSDKQCRGGVDPTASTFEVGWFPRPEISVLETEGVSRRGETFVKQDVCEGTSDSFDVHLKGSAPYHVEYETRHKPSQGSGSIGKREFDAGMERASVRMDTAKAGLYTYTFSALSDNLYNANKKRLQPLVLEQSVHARPSAAFVRPGQGFKYCMAEQENEDRIPITLKGKAPFALEVEIKHQSGSIPEIYRIASIEAHSFGIRIPRTYLRLGSQQVRIRKVRDAHGCQREAEVGGASVQIQLFEAPAIHPLETRTDYCVGERLAYSLSGTPPFEVRYTFDGTERKAKSQTTTFRRVAEAPGRFAITSVSDKASECRGAAAAAAGGGAVEKTIHRLPSARVSQGRHERVDIHEGGEVELVFEFEGTPPFEFTWTRSSNERKGARSQVLETRHDVSHEHRKVVKTSQEGTYEVVAIKDRYCAFSTQQVGAGRDGQKLLTL